CGRVLGPVSLLGHVPATAVLDAAGGQDDLLSALAEGARRAALVPAQPPGDLDSGWTVEPAQGKARAPAPSVDADGRVSGHVAWVPDAPGADVLVVVAAGASGEARAVLVDAGAEGVGVEEVRR